MAKQKINIDRSKVLRDLLHMRNSLIKYPNLNEIRYNYNSFEALNITSKSAFGFSFNNDSIFTSKVEGIMLKFIIKSLTEYYNYVTENKELLLELFDRYNEMLSKNNFKVIKDDNCVRYYSQKDYIDTIKSFYSQFGDTIYNIIKKYFDEERIQTNVELPDKDLGAIYIGIPSISSGYIFLNDNVYNSWYCAYLTHELGHAIDYETFLFSQQKTLGTLENPLSEVPSTCFEILLLDYLVESRIDPLGGLFIDNYYTNEIDQYGADVEKAFTSTSINVDPYGNMIDKDGKMFNFRNAIIYGLGYYFALHFCELKKQDPKEFLKVYNNIITSRKESSLEDIIEKFGISVQDFVNGSFIEKRIVNNNMSLKKMVNYHE